MSSYFDDLSRQVREASERHPGTDGWPSFLAETVSIEAGLIHDVNLCVGDREFPDDLRQKALALIARWHVGDLADGTLQPTEGAIDWLQTVRSSRLVDDMHSFFHDVARRRQETRFGMLSDSPAGNVQRRDAHDTEQP